MFSLLHLLSYVGAMGAFLFVTLSLGTCIRAAFALGLGTTADKRSKRSVVVGRAH
jgi:hypothetical protein